MKDKEMELGLISSILNKPRLMDQLAEKLHAELFVYPFSRGIFEKMEKMYQESGAISRTKLLVYARENYEDELEDIFNTRFVMPYEADRLVEELSNYYNQRILAETLEEAYNYIENHDMTVRERNARVQDLIFQITNQFANEGKIIYNAEEVAVECLKEMVKRQEGEAGERVRTGMRSIDNFMSGGLRRKNLTVLAGGTSMGKTSFALNIVRSILASTGHPVFIVSMEMSKEDLLDRLIVQRSKVRMDDYNRINEDGNYPLPEDMREAVERARDWVHDKKLLITDRRGLEVSHIKSLCRKAANMFGERTGFIIIDYLSEIKIQNSGENMAKLVGNTVRELRDMSKELDCHVLLLHQINRQFQNRDNSRPKKSDLRDSGEIEEKADAIMFVHRPAYFKYQQSQEDEPVVQHDAEIVVAKQRGGKTGLLKFVWYPEIQVFQEYSDYVQSGEIYYLKAEYGRGE